MDPLDDPMYDVNHNQLKAPMEVIDLTETDDEPWGRKINVLNSRKIVPSRVLDFDQPGPSSRMLGTPKRTCSTTSCPSIASVNIGCQHKFCYLCFVASLQKNQTPSFTRCSVCNAKIKDKVVEQNLKKEDYARYLEHTITNLRSTLAKIDPNYAKEFYDHLSAGDIKATQVDENVTVIINDSPVSIPDRRHSEFFHLQNLDSMSMVKNFEQFECPICLMKVAVDEGVILKNCLHSFCTECLKETIKHCGEPQIICPFNNEAGTCEFFIQDREIRAIATPDIYEKHLNRALKRGEANLENVVHCNTPDCHGFVELNAETKAFMCEVCLKINCVKCSAVHDDKTCEEYQFDIKNDAKNMEELKLSEEAIAKLVTDGKVRFLDLHTYVA